jgi:very-short-patch-repair endonuclease
MYHSRGQKYRINCLYCNTELIITKKELTRGKKYCNKDCYYKHSNESPVIVFGDRIKNDLRETRNCKVCGNEFICKKKAKKEMCSNECRVIWGNKVDIQNQRIVNMKKTNLDKYGTEYPQKLDMIKEKTKSNNIKKYGVDNPSKLDDVKDKVKNTSLLKYGENSVLKVKGFRDKISLTQKNNKKTFYDDQLKNQELVIINYNGPQLENTFKCNKCNSIFNSTQLGVNLSPICRTCNPTFKDNKLSNTIRNLLDSHNITNVLYNDRTILNGKEIDIYLPDYNIGIEINGNYYHSELNGKDKNYHISKTKLANEKGVKLIHIFENEIIFKTSIVKSRILNLLNKTPNKIYGRKCIIKELTNNECKEFLNENHLQGYTPASTNIGLFYNNELVSLMTFGKRKITGKNSLELIRFCNKINTNVIGSASKLFKYFIEKYKPEELISYADIRWSGINPDVTLYNKLGFKLKHMSSPNYWYMDKKSYLKLLHRYNFRKGNLRKKIINFDQSKTEWVNMTLNGYDRIWDCGNIVFIFNNQMVS